MPRTRNKCVSIKSAIVALPASVKLIGGAAIVLALLLSVWFYGTRLSNGISNWMFARQVATKDKQLADQQTKIDAQSKVLAQTLIELAQSKKDQAVLTARSIQLEGIFNDASKTASQKVQAFNAAMSAAPVHTDPNGVTLSDLCQRAKNIGGSPELIAALCQN